jgi:hypothetical protein
MFRLIKSHPFVLLALCAVLALALVPKTVGAISMAQPEYGYSAANINTHLMDNTGYIHDSNYSVGLNIPSGGWICAKKLTFDAFGHSLVVPAHKYARVVLSATAINLANLRVKTIYSPNENIVIGLSSQSSSFVYSNEKTVFITVDLYNDSGDTQEVVLGGYDDMICANNPDGYPSSVELEVKINTFVVYKSASSNAQEELAQEEKNAHNNIKNQNKNGDDNNNPTGKSQTLIDYFKNGIGAVQKMKKTNCNLKLDIGVVKFDEVDMCKLKVPSYIKIISSILVFSVCVPASIAIVRRIVAVVKEMQQ